MPWPMTSARSVRSRRQLWVLRPALRALRRNWLTSGAVHGLPRNVNADWLFQSRAMSLIDDPARIAAYACLTSGAVRGSG